MTREAVITIEFSDWWLSGTGRAGSGDVDAVPHRDRFGCPALPMTQVKGQLRESAERLAGARAGGWDADLVHKLFGGQDKNRAALAFRGDATLDEATARWLSQNPGAQAELTRRRTGTKIGRLGAAESRTLRALEAAVPMRLRGRVLWIDRAEPPENWVELLDAACAATLAFGKNKTDGYGRAIASCTAADPESLA
jgi:hypothetical protein